MTLMFAVISPSLHGLLIGFLVLICILAVVAGLLWAIEHWIHPIPPPVKLVIAIILVIAVLIWAIGFLTGTPS